MLISGLAIGRLKIRDLARDHAYDSGRAPLSRGLAATCLPSRACTAGQAGESLRGLHSGGVRVAPSHTHRPGGVPSPCRGCPVVEASRPGGIFSDCHPFSPFRLLAAAVFSVAISRHTGG